MRLKQELKFIGYYFLIFAISGAIVGTVVIFGLLPIAAWIKGFHGYLPPSLDWIYRWMGFTIYASFVGSLAMWICSKFR